MVKSILIGALALAICVMPAPAQEPEADRVEDIIVIARRSDVPVWEVFRGDRSLILVGAISGVPRDLDWNPAGLEAATARADRILYPPEARASLSDVGRLLWRSRTIFRLPDESTTADHLPADLQARLEAVMAGERNEAWRRRSFLILSDDLLKRAGYQRGGRTAVAVVRDAARDAEIEGRPVGFLRGDEIVGNLIVQPPSAYQPCVAASIAAAEAGAETFPDRAEAWRRKRVVEVVANPADVALNQCWPWGDPEIGPQLRGLWLTALSEAVDQPGVTLAVAPLRLLAEPGGVLDGLEADGFEIVGPEWRAD